jgi:hypothetical protein
MFRIFMALTFNFSECTSTRSLLQQHLFLNQRSPTDTDPNMPILIIFMAFLLGYPGLPTDMAIHGQVHTFSALCFSFTLVAAIIEHSLKCTDGLFPRLYDYDTSYY